MEPQEHVQDPVMPGQPALIRFTPQEINALRSLINIAVKTAGLQVAQAALYLDGKLVKALPQETNNASQPRPEGRPSRDAKIQARQAAQRELNGANRKG